MAISPEKTSIITVESNSNEFEYDRLSISSDKNKKKNKGRIINRLKSPAD